MPKASAPPGEGGLQSVTRGRARVARTGQEIKARVATLVHDRYYSVWPFRAVCPYHLINMITVIAVSIAIIISNYSKFQFPLSVLSREFPVPDPQILLGHEAPE